MLTLPDNVWLSGFRVSGKYFADVAPIMRAEFAVRSRPSPENHACIEQMAQGTSVSVHVRRGDYLDESNSARFGVLDVGYYERAAHVIRERCSDPVFFVFSDDLDWARAHLSLGDVHFIDHNHGGPSSEDLRLMSACRHNIIATSTYSWWGAWLNPNPDRIVIAPNQWMANPSYDTRDVLPSDWLALRNDPAAQAATPDDRR